MYGTVIRITQTRLNRTLSRTLNFKDQYLAKVTTDEIYLHCAETPRIKRNRKTNTPFIVNNSILKVSHISHSS